MKHYCFEGRIIIDQPLLREIMKTAHLKDMVNGWFVGNFHPTLIKTNEFEVAVKEYRKGECENRHHHKIATEITVIASGRVRINGVEYTKGDIVVIPPNQATDFEVLEDTITTVVKYPGANNDKYSGDPA
jgi:mannose-6-phosphate isomerase-like protein (cupin superfamily)